MKAIARVCLLLMLVVSFTGFGSTTADLTQNSQSIMIDNDIGMLESVVAVVPVNKFQDNVVSVETFIVIKKYGAVKTETKNSNLKSNNIFNFDEEFFYYQERIQSDFINKSIKPPAIKESFRKPRDGFRSRS